MERRTGQVIGNTRPYNKLSLLTAFCVVRLTYLLVLERLAGSDLLFVVVVMVTDTVVNSDL